MRRHGLGLSGLGKGSVANRSNESPGYNKMRWISWPAEHQSTFQEKLCVAHLISYNVIFNPRTHYIQLKAL